MAKRGKWFASEASMCSAFIEAATRDKKWIAYAETANWDLLLVRKADGFQIGIQAKLELNAKVIQQAWPRWFSCGESGPDTRAVLVPFDSSAPDIAWLCGRLGITVIVQRKPDDPLTPAWQRRVPFTPALPDRGDEFNSYRDDWHPWCPVRRHTLPEYVPDVAAGASAPATLSHWKIQAIKLAIILESRPVTRADFKVLGISPTRWVDKHTGWLNATPAGYVANASLPDFKTMHPTNYEQIKSDRDKWEKDLLERSLPLLAT